MNKELVTRLAKLLLERSYKEGDFTLASGKKSTYYFDCRVSALHAEGAHLIGHVFNDLIRKYDIQGVAGMTMGADPLVSATSLISFQRNFPKHGLLIRKQAKDHGTGQFVEGLANFKEGDKVVVLEDVVTTGGSCLTACKRVEEAGLKVVAVLAILDREEGGREAVEKAGYKFESIFTKTSLVAYK